MATQTTSAPRTAASIDSAAVTPRRSASAARRLGPAARDPDLRPVALAQQRAHVRLALDAGADDREHVGVRAREQPRGEARAGRGARRRDRVAVHQRDRRAGGGVEDDDRRLVGGVVAGEQRDELDRHRRGVVGVRAHQQDRAAGRAPRRRCAAASRPRPALSAANASASASTSASRSSAALDVGAAEDAQPQSPAPQVSGSRKPSGNGSSGSSTNWWMPVIQARPEIAGTIAVDAADGRAADDAADEPRADHALVDELLAVADQPAGGEHGQPRRGRGPRRAAVEPAGGDDGGVARVAAVARRGGEDDEGEDAERRLGGVGDLELLGDRRADALAEVGELARLLGHDRVAERLGVDERAERAAVGDVDPQLPDPRDVDAARRGGSRTTARSRT